MDINDFKGLKKYKFVIPAIFITSWVFMLLGPVLFPLGYQRFCLFWLIYVDIKILMMLSIMIGVLIRFLLIMKKYKKVNQSDINLRESINTEHEINYGFIIPNYKEDIELLQQTLDVLANHRRAKERYLIFLAMEKHEEGSEEKAIKLIAANKNKFRVVDFTLHEVRVNQQKGKASNVSWCAEHLQPIFEANHINSHSVMLTVIDADSWAPDLYIDLVDEHLQKNILHKDRIIYQPPQIFTRNNLEVPIITRVQDIMHSFGHVSNLYSVFNITFPLSNYSISYNMIKEIGFWDTCADAIGEDFHTTQKAYWKTLGQLKTVPIYAPFNQVNIQTDKGYWEDVKARFWQSERHAKGVADVAYEMKMLLNQKFRVKNLLVVYNIVQLFTLTAVVPWIFISMFFESKVLYENHGLPEPLYSEWFVNIFYQIMWIAGSTAYLLYEGFKRYANSALYKQQNEHPLRILEYIVVVPVNLFAINMTTFTIASFNSPCGNNQYVVAEKKTNASRLTASTNES